MSINGIFPNLAISEFLYLVIGGEGCKKSLTAKKSMMYGTFPLLTPWSILIEGMFPCIVNLELEKVFSISIYTQIDSLTFNTEV